jgi:hypothetical protein
MRTHGDVASVTGIGPDMKDLVLVCVGCSCDEKLYSEDLKSRDSKDIQSRGFGRMRTVTCAMVCHLHALTCDNLVHGTMYSHVQMHTCSPKEPLPKKKKKKNRQH